MVLGGDPLLTTFLEGRHGEKAFGKEGERWHVSSASFNSSAMFRIR